MDEKYNSLTVQQLKEKLRELGQSAAGTKTELILRLSSIDPSGECVEGDHEDTRNETAQNTGKDVEWMRREMEIALRERDIVQKELEVARREIEVIQRTQNLNLATAERQPDATRMLQQADSPPAPVPREIQRPRSSVTAIADLLNHYDGDGAYELWERQFQLLREAHQLTNDETMILLGLRLKGKAMEWFHSRPEYVAITPRELLAEMRAMFYHPPSKVARKREFEQRCWKQGERFSEYYHHKVILGNRVPIDNEELIEYLIEGIPDITLRNQAHIERFETKAALLTAFEKVVLQASAETFRTVKKPAEKGKSDNEKQRFQAKEGHPKDYGRCHSCGAKGHRMAECPTKERGTKCFQCREFGHIAAKCPRKITAVADKSCTGKSMKGKYTKIAKINGLEIAALVDTGSDITLIRSDVYIKLGAPRLQYNAISFSGIGSVRIKTLGEFTTNVNIDDNLFPITIHVVPESVMRRDFILGADFLETVQLIVRPEHIEICELNQPSENNLPDVLQVNVCTEVDRTDLTHVRDLDVKKRLISMLENYEPKGTRQIGVEMSIVLTDEEPVYQRARRLSVKEREEVNAHIREWLSNGVIQPSLSDFASPVVLVRKKDGSSRLCVDFRRLNQKTIKDRYPLPLIDDQLDALQGAKVYSTLDLKNGFFHVAVKPECRKYTSFVVPDGQYEFMKVPFGLCNSPAVFQKFINAVFRELINKKEVLTYMDDLIVPSVDVKSGLEKLEKVLKTASEASLIINWKKCQLLQTRVEFLGHIVEGQVVRPSESKTKAVMKFRQPTSVRDVQSFLGLTGYFRKFICHYSLIAKPLTDLLKRDERFRFEAEHVHAFEQLKRALVNDPVLRLYKIGAPIELHTDASRCGYGSILLQQDGDDGKLHPIYYASGKTSAAESKYSSYELECLAIVRALRKFRVYLLGVPFKIVTDCRAFTLTMKKKDLCVRVARWALLLEEFQYTIEHRSGSSMKHVDALSRYPLPECMIVSESDDSINARLKRAQEADEDISKLVRALKENPIDGYCVRNGLLFKVVDEDYKIVVPRSMQTNVIRRAHQIGHFAVSKTESLVKRDYWFGNMKGKIERLIQNCVACILADRKSGKNEGFLHSIEKGETPLDTYHIDHLGPLVSTKKKYNYIFAVVDGFSKFTWLYATKSTTSAEVVDKLRKQSVAFGNPRRIISDRGTAFTSGEFKNYCVEEGIEHVLITTGMPRSNGQVERMNRILCPVLTKLTAPHPNEWYKHVDRCQGFLNATFNRSIGMTPFHLMFGINMRLQHDQSLKELLEQEWAIAFNESRCELREQAKESIAKIQRENKINFNKRRKRAKLYVAGDLVAIKRTQTSSGTKLAAKYFGPYQVVKVLRNDRYMVEKTGDHEGPKRTSTAAEHMKAWISESDDNQSDKEDLVDI